MFREGIFLPQRDKGTSGLGVMIVKGPLSSDGTEAQITVVVAPAPMLSQFVHPDQNPNTYDSLVYDPSAVSNIRGGAVFMNIMVPDFDIYLCPPSTEVIEKYVSDVVRWVGRFDQRGWHRTLEYWWASRLLEPETYGDLILDRFGGFAADDSLVFEQETNMSHRRDTYTAVLMNPVTYDERLVSARMDIDQDFLNEGIETAEMMAHRALLNTVNYLFDGFAPRRMRIDQNRNPDGVLSLLSMNSRHPTRLNYMSEHDSRDTMRATVRRTDFERRTLELSKELIPHVIRKWFTTLDNEEQTEPQQSTNREERNQERMDATEQNVHLAMTRLVSESGFTCEQATTAFSAFMEAMNESQFTRKHLVSEAITRGARSWAAQQKEAQDSRKGKRRKIRTDGL